MPIRPRGPSWQVDVRLPDGKRYRKTVPTEADAEALEAALQVSPQQRRAMKKALRHSPGAQPSAAQPCPISSLQASAASQEPNSRPQTSAKSVVEWPSTLKPPTTGG